MNVVEGRLDSRLSSVVVHAAGAVCVRVAVGKVAPGTRRVVVAGLPLGLAEQSLRARVRSGPAGLRVTDVRLEVAAAVREPERRSLTERELKDAEGRRQALRERCAWLGREVERTGRLKAGGTSGQPWGGPPPGAAVESLLALAGFVDRRMRQLYERLEPLEAELRRVEREVDVLRARLARESSALQTGAVHSTAAAVVTVDGPEDAASAECEFEVEYLVAGATWLPVYQLRLDRAADGGSALVLRACVAQRTGEDWSGVRLGLSTADLQRRTDLPELRSLRIGRRQSEPVPSGWREPPAGLEGLFASYDAAVEARTAVGTAVGTVVGTAKSAGPAASDEWQPRAELWEDDDASAAPPPPYAADFAAQAPPGGGSATFGGAGFAPAAGPESYGAAPYAQPQGYGGPVPGGGPGSPPAMPLPPAAAAPQRAPVSRAAGFRSRRGAMA
ncbi:DUF4139 domain-containing protein, partial [Streptomyces sp. NPDC051940]|uniref:DUF4139 domain-containing protein n=1 Tax=Streptomyces sp. NPDC051940 TaxID=3155675 RepID=UPI00341FA2E2